jgi:methionyl-tRNA synthetase
VGGVKMSKSRGTFVTAAEYLAHLDPQYLRYYFAANLAPAPHDIDLSPGDFTTRVNAELVGNLANYLYRVLSFCAKQQGGRLGTPDRGDFEREVLTIMERIAAAYEALDLRRAVRETNALGDVANRWFQAQAPWKLAKTDPAAATRVVTTAVNLARTIAVALKPVVPRLVAEVERVLGGAPLTWDDRAFTLADRTIGEPAVLVTRVEPERVERVWSAAPAAAMPVPDVLAPATPSPPAAAVPPVRETIDLETFARVDLRVGEIVSAERVAKSQKLLKLRVDIGEEAGPRQVVAGIGQAYAPESLVGLRVILVANLAPAKLMGVESRGMVLAAGPGGAEIVLARFVGEVEKGTPPAGTRVK